MSDRSRDTTVQFVLPCADLDAAARFLSESLGFRLDRIRPADAPRVAQLSGYGVSLRLEVDPAAAPGRLHLVSRDPELLARIGDGQTGPGGTLVTAERADAELVVPRPTTEVVVTPAGAGATWAAGRAGMQYRDLLPGRLGGAFIASHIRIPEGGPVPDYVHHHDILFQIIYCVGGSVRLVYEDQGEPFTMQAGDCVLQPPHIRHRVLDCSDKFEVVEVGAPAEHDTFVDHDLDLPNGRNPERLFSGQAFVHHRAADARWQRSEYEGVEARDSGIADATGGLVSLRVLRWPRPLSSLALAADETLQFRFVLEGEVALDIGADPPQRLAAHAAFALPAGVVSRLDSDAPGALLEVTTSF